MIRTMAIAIAFDRTSAQPLHEIRESIQTTVPDLEPLTSDNKRLVKLLRHQA